MTELKDHSILVTGDRPEVDTYEIIYETKLSRVTGFRLEAIPDERLPNYGPGRGSYNGDGRTNRQAGLLEALLENNTSLFLKQSIPTRFQMDLVST